MYQWDSQGYVLVAVSENAHEDERCCWKIFLTFSAVMLGKNRSSRTWGHNDAWTSMRLRAVGLNTALQLTPMLISSSASGCRLGDSNALKAPASFLIVRLPRMSWLLKNTVTYMKIRNQLHVCNCMQQNITPLSRGKIEIHVPAKNSSSCTCISRCRCRCRCTCRRTCTCRCTCRCTCICTCTCTSIKLF